jgi:hypothetical protein
MKVTSYAQFQFIKADFQTSIEDIKSQYKKLALKLHPDMGGSVEDMARLNVEFDFCKCHNFNIHKSKSGDTYTDQTQDTPDDVTNNFVDIIEQLIHMEGLEVEICGSFLWVGGSTKEHKDELKSIGFRWASKKKRWFLAPQGWRKKGRRELSMSEIRSSYGSQRINYRHAAGRLLTE